MVALELAFFLLDLEPGSSFPDLKSAFFLIWISFRYNGKILGPSRLEFRLWDSVGWVMVRGGF